MTQARPNLLMFLAENLQDILHMADVLSEGEPCRVILLPGRDPLAERLRHCGLDGSRLLVDAAAPAAPRDPLPRLRSLPKPDGAPTDTIDLALDLSDTDGSPLGMLVMRGVAATALPRMRIAALESIGMLLQRHLRALSMGSALVAAPVLSVISALHDGADPVASMTLTGLLKALAGEPGSLAEATSLRIAGLAEAGADALHSREVTLTPEAQVLLRQAGLAGLDTIQTQPRGNRPSGPSGPIRRADLPAAFARLRVIDMDFDITEDRPDGPLWFRKSRTTDTWQQLDSVLADGWTTVAAEILRTATDIVTQFAQMHMLRRRDLPTDEIAEAYELAGHIWWLRRDGAQLDIRRDGGEWVRTPIDPDLPQRERSVSAVLWHDPSLRTRVQEASEAWVDRMAQAVQVHPATVAA